MTASLARHRRSSGLSLIEIMIALAIGSLLILGLVQVFAASRTAYQLSEGISRSQENARFAMEYLQRDIRMAGHYGCVNDQSHLQNAGALNATHFGPVSSATMGRDFPVGVRGYDATGTVPDTQLNLAAPAAGWVPALPGAISALNPIPGSDVLELRFLASEGTPVATITNPTPTTTLISVDRWDPLISDGVANPTMFGIADCSYADVFPATAVNPGARTVAVNAVINRYTPQPSGQTMLYRAESLVYFLRRKPAPSGQVALYRARSNNAGTYAAADVEELVEGIENLQFLFGLDREDDLVTQPPTGFIDVNVPASDGEFAAGAVAWRRTGLVQVGLLAASPNPSAAGAPEVANRRRALGVTYVPPAAGDTNYRASYEATVALRNRLYGN